MLKGSSLQVFFKIGVANIFANFTGKSLCWSRFLINLQARRPATLLKTESNTGVFLWNLQNFQALLFYNKPTVAASERWIPDILAKTIKKNRVFWRIFCLIFFSFFFFFFFCSEFLCNYFNESLEQDKFLYYLKLANIKPVFIKGVPTLKSNHKTVSMLSVLCYSKECLTNNSKIFWK